MRKKIGIIGQFPPPMHGLSKALDTLYNSYLNKEFDFIKIDLTNNKEFFKNIVKILFSKLDLYYLTISQSKFGNIRDLIIIKLIQIKKRKVIIHLHGGGFRNILDNEFSDYQKRLNYKILSKVDAGIVLGDSLKYIFEGIIPENKIYIVKNCVDNEFVISEEEFNKKIIALKDKDKFNILYLSNFIEDKGYKDVLYLARYCKQQQDRRFTFVFAGKFFDDKSKKEFFEYISENKLQSIINYKGIVKGLEKKELLKNSDYFILPTRYKNEGQPISIIEAAINGLRIVSTDHAGIKDILNEKEMILIKNKKSIEFDKLYDDLNYENSHRNKMIKSLMKNREKMFKEFTEKIYLNEIKDIFYKIVK